MAEHILNMVKTADPEAIEKYVKNHLPNDPVSLQRIYKQLLTFNANPQQSNPLKTTKRSNSMKSITSSRSSPKIKPVHQDQIIKTTNLIKSLRDKGHKVVGDLEEEGLSLYQSHRNRLVKPLITNSKLLRSEQAMIDKLIHRYNINSQFYNQKVEKGLELEIDLEMKNFLTRRESILEVLKEENLYKSLKNKRFSHIEQKYTHPKGIRVSFERIPSLKKSEQSLAQVSSSKRLLDTCQNQLKLEKYKTIDTRINFFKNIALQIQNEQTENQYAQLEDAKTFRDKVTDQQYKRYTNSYMDMLTKKIRTGSKCKLNSYDKDLLRDAKRMRKIIDFSSK